ncbi:MAG: hypothetical protein SGJ18_05360 [Pseudomonadota bacterium]|nr:hypothetical protein [Pseudomonadota bacterium]
MLKRRNLVIIVSLLVILAGLLFLIKKEKELHRLIETKLITLVNQDILGATGMVIEELKFETSYKNLFRGYLSELSLRIRSENIRATLDGPLRYALIGWGKRHYFNYKPTIIFEKISSTNAKGQLSTPLDVSLQLTLNKNFNEVLKFLGETDVDKFDWKALGLSIEKPVLNLSFIPLKNHFSLSIKTKSLSYESPDKTIMVGLQNPHLKVTSQMDQIFRFSIESKGAEVLNGKDYFDIPLDEIKLAGDISTKLSNINLLIQSKKDEWATRLTLDKVKFDWRVDINNLRLFLPWLTNTFNLTAIKETIWKSGSLKARIAGPLASPLLLNKLIKNSSGFFALENLSFSPQNNVIKVSGLNLYLPFNSKKKTTGSLALNNLEFRRLEAKIPPTPILISSLSHISINKPLVIENNASHLTFEDFKLDFFNSTPYYLKSKMRLGPTPLKDIFNSLCIKQSMPTSELAINFDHVEFNENNLKTEGDVTLKFLGGEAKLNELKMYRLFSSVPETHFDLKWQDMKLQDINNFVRFGKMEGDFEGYFRNVVFQGSLPTQFNFLFKVNPGKRGQVVFSSRAMKNFIQLFTPEDFQKYMVGPLNWFAFGWASDLIGGYNIDYAGLSLYSHQGSILLETLDPEAVVKNTKKRFILSGPRVKVPVQSRSYPIVLDAYGITNFMTHISSQVDAINSEAAAEVGSKKFSNKEIANAVDPCLNFKKNE